MKTIKFRNPDKIFFTADLHLHHEKLMSRFRTQFKSLDEMHDHIIQSWNDTVPEDGIVFILGDLGWKSAKEHKAILDELNGEIRLVRGNHDDKHVIFIGENPIVDILYEGNPYISIIEDDNTRQDIQLSHYPLLGWHANHHGSWNIHGHEHGNMNNTGLLRRDQLDVGLDSCDFKILSFQEVKHIIEYQKNDTIGKYRTINC